MLLDIPDIGTETYIATALVPPTNAPNVIQNLVLSPIRNTYFPWLCLLLLVSSDNIRRPLIYYAITHWSINTLGDILYQSVFLYKPEFSTFPFSNRAYILSVGISSVLFLLSEILGDWYLLVRTKVLIRNNKKGLIFLYLACVLFNMMKVAEMIIYLRYEPFPTDPNITKDEGQLMAIYGQRFSTVIDQRLNVLVLQQITSLIYDILVIVILKNNVFTKNEVGLSKNTFLNKFKQLSEYRIYLGVLIAVIVSPFIFAEVVLLKKSQLDYYNVIYVIRSKLLNFFYVFMYIDQISLRFFVEKTTVIRSNYNISNNSTNSNHKSYYNNSATKSSSNATLTYNQSNTSLYSVNSGINNMSFNNSNNLTYNKSSSSLRSLAANNNVNNYNNQINNNYNNQAFNSNYSISVSDYNSQNINNPNYRLNNYNMVNNISNNNNNEGFYNYNEGNNSISEMFYNKIKHQNQIEYDDNRYLIDKKYNQYRK